MKEIRNIIHQYDSMDWTEQKAALATVVSVEESAYRRIGARMFVQSSGVWIGGISGGCLEGDALKRAQMAIHKDRPTIVVYDTMEDDAHQIGVGLGCNGRIEVLFTPINREATDNPIEILRKIIHRREPHILFQLIADHSGKHVLGKVFLDKDQSGLSNLLQLEPSKLQDYSQAVMEKGKSKVYTTTAIDGQEYVILVEYLRPEVQLVLIGDNYDVNAFVGIADELGWQIHVVGLIRKIGKAVFEKAHQVLPYEQVSDIKIDKHSAVVLMSHDYHWDMQMLKHFMQHEVGYVGMLGPRKRMMKMQHELTTDHPTLDLENLSHFYSPVGLDLGAESPEEIALSITAEIVAVFRNRSGTHLKFREGTIHEREL